ncbi:GSCFA domain-containing protein [Kordiimonas aestuarii]|uniref:GSCFA domain-containing protein n=1 Tax=Kordiimonas aestuarii TaxID=1005925 RepID=UPI0021CFA852|nr:GSCFA domain-containing protein [Kordiimonas aestuarii]
MRAKSGQREFIRLQRHFLGEHFLGTPYQQQGRHQFWRTAARGWPDRPDLKKLYRRKFKIALKGGELVATAGSCFAQHIRRELIARDCAFLDVEPPMPFIDEATQHKFGFNLFSARYGNIYTTAQLRQLAERAFAVRQFTDTVWEDGGRFYDVFRPTIEPDGFRSLAELEDNRESHLWSVRNLLSRTQVFIFTLGLTEAWRARADGLVYPLCPGTTAGKFDPERHEFVNYTCADVVRDFEAFMEIVQRKNPDIRFVLTVSPVPLVATATDDHVVAATSHSKAILRTAAGELYNRHANVDYFPSYEIFTTPLAAARFYADDKRNPTPEGVSLAMEMFFAEHGEVTDGTSPLAPMSDQDKAAADFMAEAAKTEAICDEILLGNEQRGT